MAKKWKKIAALSVATVMTATTLSGLLSACGDKSGDLYTFNDYTAVSPSNWNVLTYEDNNDTQIMGYIASSFWEFDYKFDESKGGKYNKDGSINADAIVEGEYEIIYSAATKLEDVTSSVNEKWGYEDGDKGYAYKITLRQDLTWDDGTPIKAKDFVYSMKEQLNPLFANYRADSYYNSSVNLINAKSYVFQGSSGTGAGWIYGTSFEDDKDTMKFNFAHSDWGDYWISTNKEAGLSTDPAYALWRAAANYDGPEALAGRVAKEDGSGYTYPAQEAFLKEWDGKTLEECLADTGIMKEYLDWIIDYIFPDVYKVDMEELGDDVYLYIFDVDYVFPEVDFEDVGIYAASDYELVICLESSLDLFKEDGKTLSYRAPYYLSDLPLVKEDLYESCKVAPAPGATLWTSKYCSSLETTASWGPYKLTSFQTDKQYILEKNDKWFGFGEAMKSTYGGQFQVDRIVCDTIEKHETAWLSFMAGELDAIGVSVTEADEYKNSAYAYFTPSSGTYSVNILGDLEHLRNLNHNSEILAIDEFRQAISVGINRADYNTKLTTSSLPCYGLLNSVYYYDVENGLTYRGSDAGKKALLRTYGFIENENGTWTYKGNTYTFEQAYNEAFTGYDLELARELVQTAYQKLTAAGSGYQYDSTKDITFVYGTSVNNESTERDRAYMEEVFKSITEGTPLAGKIKVVIDDSFGSNWATALKNGEYELGIGTGWSGAAWDPGYLLLAYLDPNYMYSKWWDSASETMTFTLPAGDYDGAGETLTFGLLDWYGLLNGDTTICAKYGYNWASGEVEESVRLELIAALEEHILKKYYTIPTTGSYGCSLHSVRWDYINYTYNSFMGFGGIQYMVVHYTDSEWASYVKSQGGDFADFYKGNN